LTDFGLSKTGMGAASVSNSFCGSVAYLAPEMLRRAGHTKSIDWYLLGVLIYEMLVGVPPYFNPDKTILFKNIEMGPLKIPHTMPQPARNIILLLLNRNPAKRLGSNCADASDIKSHEFFAEIDWERVDKRDYPVMAPKVKNLGANPKAV
jgi:serine/threonine protein kinase